MTTFNEHWQEKAQKRRKSWTARSKRFSERHIQLNAIRREVVFGRMDRSEMLNLLDEHRTVQNPIARWDLNMHFSFSEQGLREAMQAEGADADSITMTVSKNSIVGQQPHDLAYGTMLDLASNRLDLYEKYTDLETCTINYREVTMVIYRYTYLQQPFALYVFVPCKQLSFTDLRLEETSFSTLNIATLLMEMAAEYELRNEELNYHAKKLRLRTMDAALTGDIEFKLWDAKKLEKKVAEYIDKDCPVENIIKQVLRPWKQSIAKYFHAITEQEQQKAAEKFYVFNLKNSHNLSSLYIKDVLQPFFYKHGLRGVKMWIPDKESSPLYMESQGYLAKYDPWDDAFYPNAHYPMCIIYGELHTLPLRALAYYLQKMPEISKKTDEVVLKVMLLYDQLMQQKNEEYRKNIEYLDSLVAQYTGKPVGKMMKFLRWNTGRFGRRLSISSIKVLGETSFSFLERTTLMMGNQHLLHKEEVKERWLDADCQYLYTADPVTTDFDKWVKTHGKGMRIPWKWPMQDFLRQYSSGDSKPPLSFDFIEQQL